MRIKAETTVAEMQEAVAEACCHGRFVWGTVLQAAGSRLTPERDVERGIYSSLLDLAERTLKGIAAGDAEGAAWAYTLLQEQIPAARERAGLEAPSELETELREGYGIPEPGSSLEVVQ